MPMASVMSGLMRKRTWFGGRAVGRIHRGRALQPHHHLGAGHRQVLAGADVERHACQRQESMCSAQRGEGLGAASPAATPGSVQVAVELAAHEVARARACASRCSTFTFSSRIDSLSVRTGGSIARLAQHLEQVVLHHVADRAGLVVERAAALHAEVLGHGDLHALDVVAVPERLEEGVGEAEEAACCAPAPCRGSGRCGRCATSSKLRSRTALSARAEARSWPNGFSTTTRAPCVQPAAASCSTTVANSAGGIAR